MIYKILLVKNRYFPKVNLTKYLDWFKLNTPIEIIMEETTSDFDVDTQEVTNGTYTGVICKNTLLPKLREIIPENKYNVVVFLYGNQLDGIRVNVCDGLGRQDFLYKNTSVIQIFNANDGGKILNHELFHTFFAKLNRLGIQVNDNMDTYIGNTDLTIDGITNTNREVALQTLKPYWDQICSLNIIPPVPQQKPLAILVRNKTTGKETLGDLIAINDTVFVCKTLERGIDLRIPAGTYQVDWTFSPKFNRNMYLVRVPGIEGIRIHPGNFYSDSEGCIMLGKTVADINHDGELDITTSRDTVQAFENLFNQRSLTLIVI
jgi:hypothetical protein